MQANVTVDMEELKRARPILNSRMRVRKEDVGCRKRAHRWGGGGFVDGCVVVV